MKKTILIIVLAALCLNFLAQAQIKSLSTGLKIGDQVPDVTLNIIINYPTKSAKISDFKGKLLILDFWGTYCGACIYYLPHIDSLNKQLNNLVFILPVSSQPETTVRSFLKSNGYVKGITGTSVVEDISLNKLFPHNELPHEVWINREGKVIGITFPDYVTRENIELAAKGGNPRWQLKKDDLSFSSQEPVLFDTATLNNKAKPILYGTLITGNISGIGINENVVVDTTLNRKRLSYINVDLINLFSQTNNTGLAYIPTRRLLKVKHPKDFYFFSDSSHYQEWQQLHTYSFESIAPKDVLDTDILKEPLDNLERMLHVKAEIRSVNMKCWVLQRINDQINFISSYQRKNYLVGNRPLEMQYVTSSDLVYYMNQQEHAEPTFDETLLKKRFDLHLKTWPTSLNEWNTVLLPLGLALKTENRLIDVFVLTEDPLAVHPENRPTVN